MTDENEGNFITRTIGDWINIGVNWATKKGRIRQMQRYGKNVKQSIEFDMKDDLQNYEQLMEDTLFGRIEKQMDHAANIKLKLCYLYGPKTEGSWYTHSTDQKEKANHDHFKSLQHSLGMAHYTSELAELENTIFTNGTFTKDTNNKWIANPRTITYEPRFNKQTRDMDPPKEEVLNVIGFSQIHHITSEIDALETKLLRARKNSSIWQLQFLRKHINERIAPYIKSHAAYASTVQETINLSINTAAKLRNQKMEEWVRFPHTYKIIKQFKKDDVGNIVYFHHAFPNFKRGKDIFPGLDENGKPLEVRQKTDGNYEVLVDVWNNEICENPWQKKHAELDTEETLQRRDPVRTIPKEWQEDLDPLLMVTFRHNEWDAIRDDFRDGRYHPYSNTYLEYLLYGEQTGFPTSKINHTKLGLDRPLIHRTPIKRTELPKDEQDVFKLRMRERYYWDGSNYVPLQVIPNSGTGLNEVREDRENEPDAELPGPTNQNWFHYRKPSHLNPAFDRSIVGIYTEPNNHWRHWGRLHYYGGPSGINRFGKNPDPCVSTRGYAKYLINWALSKSPTFEIAADTLKNSDVSHWDFGIRGWMKKGTSDPLRNPIGEDM